MSAHTSAVADRLNGDKWHRVEVLQATRCPHHLFSEVS